MDARRGSVFFSSPCSTPHARDGRRRFAVARVLWLKSLFSYSPRWCKGRGAWKQRAASSGDISSTERGSNRQSAIGARSRGSAMMVILDRRTSRLSAPQKHARAFRASRSATSCVAWGRFVHVFLLMTLMLVPTGAHRPRRSPFLFRRRSSGRCPKTRSSLLLL